MRSLVRLGLTGGIGSGKSTVAQMLENQGARVIDADAISRQLTAAGGAALPLIAKTFGPDFVDSNGAMDRDKMRALVYADASARQRLEAIVHPLVAQSTHAQAQDALDAGCACVVFDIPLLVESPVWRQKVDHVLVVDCTPEIQIERVMRRSQMTREEVEKIITAQASRARRLRAADTVISNTTLSLDQLADEVQYISRRFGLSSDQSAAPTKTSA